MTALGWRRWVPIPVGLVLGFGSGSALDALNVADGPVAGAVALLVFLHAFALCFVPPFADDHHARSSHELRRQIWFFALPLPAAGFSVAWLSRGLLEGSHRMWEGIQLFSITAPLLGVAWSVDRVSRHLGARLKRGWLRTPVCVAGSWFVAMATALVLAFGAPKLAHYPMYGVGWRDLSSAGNYYYPWVTQIILVYAGIHATALSVLAPVSEASWRWTPSVAVQTRPWALYAVIPAAALQLAWVVLAWDGV